MISISDDLLSLEQALGQLSSASDLQQGTAPLLSLARCNLLSLAEQVRHLKDAVLISVVAKKQEGGRQGGNGGSVGDEGCVCAVSWPQPCLNRSRRPGPRWAHRPCPLRPIPCDAAAERDPTHTDAQDAPLSNAVT